MVIQYEIFNLFINKNTKFTHLYIPKQFDCLIHLIPGADQCFSELEYLFCQTSINENILIGLTDICRSIKAVKLFVDNNYIIKVLSFFVNIKSLELLNYRMTSDHIENLPLPSLQVLKAKGIPINVLERLIENTSGLLTEIRIDGISHNEINNKRIIQAIYQYCPNLKYLKIVFRYNVFDIDYLFEILAKSSPINLFKFKFKFRYRPVKLESLKSFFDNWKGRHPMYLHFIKKLENNIDDLIDLIEEYKTIGIIKKFNNGLDCKDFEWI
ncbi:11313_t:CDS:2 [Rhizophagus irregularis]|nr:11313_t:CDS:2 [Rhizophagus irregularis]